MRVSILAAGLTLALARCTCGQPCESDGDCAADQICTRGLCSVGNRLDLDAALHDAGSADAALVDHAALDTGGADRAPVDRNHQDAGARQPDARQSDARQSDARQPDRQQPDAALVDRTSSDVSGLCEYNGQRCDDGDALIVDELCLDGECIGYSALATVNCGASCTWPPTETCYFSLASTTVTCGDNCRCGPTALNPATTQAICGNHSVCFRSFISDSVDLSCGERSRCYFDCLAGSTCAADCAATAMCRLGCDVTSTCTRGTCAGGWQYCSLASVWVCHRDCPY